MWATVSVDSVQIATRAPSCAAAYAASHPAWPAPITITSKRSFISRSTQKTQRTGGGDTGVASHQHATKMPRREEDITASAATKARSHEEESSLGRLKTVSYRNRRPEGPAGLMLSFSNTKS